ncbi:hypothetical protein DFH11DRAFT_1734787 [Phellopilus nigrolimitatus]|nr:hypothetical protein DFH11DRAFT_1734787 [Phellopilus nigrolimitatus]
MGRAHWTTKPQRVFLACLIPAFIEAQHEERIKAFLSSSYEAYLKKFPLRAPTAEEIALAGGSADVVHIILKNALVDRIHDWFYNHGRELTSGSGKWGYLNLNKKKKCGTMQQYQMYMKIRGIPFKEETKAAYREYKAGLAPGEKPKAHVAFAAAKAKTSLAAEMEETRERVAELTRQYNVREIEEILPDNSGDDKSDDDSGSGSPKPAKAGTRKADDRISRMQKAINVLPESIECVHYNIEDQTNWYATTIFGGPNPRRGGQLSLFIAHRGKTHELGHEWPATDAKFNDNVIGSYKRFLEAAFPPEVAEKFALKEGNQGNQGEGNQGDEDRSMRRSEVSSRFNDFGVGATRSTADADVALQARRKEHEAILRDILNGDELETTPPPEETRPPPVEQTPPPPSPARNETLPPVEQTPPPPARQEMPPPPVEQTLPPPPPTFTGMGSSSIQDPDINMSDGADAGETVASWVTVSSQQFRSIQVERVLSRSVHPRSSANRTCDTNRTSGHLERPLNPLSFIPLDFVRLESSSFSSFGLNPLHLAGILSIRSESLVLRSSGLVASPFGSNCSSFVPQDSYDSDPLRSAGFLSVRFEPLVRRPSGLVRLGSPSFGGIPLGSVRTSRPSFLRTRTAWIPFVTPLRPAGIPFLRPESSPFGSALLRSAGIPSVWPEPSSFGLVILRPAGISSVRP